MGIIMFGIFVFSMAYLLTPLFSFTKQLHNKAFEIIKDTQLASYQGMESKPFQALATSLVGSIAGMFLALGGCKFMFYLVDTYMSKDSIFAVPISLGLIFCVLVTPIIFAVHVKAVVDTWLIWKHKISD